MNRTTFLTLAVIVTLQVGCSLAPTYTRPEAPVPAAWPGGAPPVHEEARSGKAAADIAWRDFFVDEKLQQVINLALSNNRNLRVAALNVERTQALYRIQRAELLPAVNAGATFSKERVPGILSQSGNPATVELYNVNLGVSSWEIDLFPLDFIREGLLRFCFAEDEDQRSQVSFVEQRVRVQLARWAFPVHGQPGAAVLCQPPPGASYVLERVIAERRDPRPARDGVLVRDFVDLVDFLADKVSADAPGYDPAWIAGAAPGTVSAFLRRLYAQGQRLGHLVTTGVHKVTLARAINVVDIHGLHESAQRFVVGALLSRVFADKQGAGREPLRFVVLDELNKYAPRQGTSPIKELLVDIAARGRSLGVLLIGAQQAASDVDGNIIRNAALKVVGRLDAGEASEYRFLNAELRERAARFLPGTMVLDQPLIPAPIPLRFPFPGFATNPFEGAPDPAAAQAAEDDAFGRLE